MGLVDWQLLLLFIGLFVVNHALATTGLTAQAVAWLGPGRAPGRARAAVRASRWRCPTWSATCRR
jgi:Na+/H+ antiporter NhaD/arsenite permease-like protein